jgi:hypothetical protein
MLKANTLSDDGSTMARLFQIFVALLAVAACAGAAFLVTNRVQQSVPLVGGLDGCWRLATPVSQVDCLSRNFLDGADKAADGKLGLARDKSTIAYVREVEHLAASDERLARSCHQGMHELGRSEGRRASAEDRVPTFPTASTQLCTAGYVHGLAEGYLAETPDAVASQVYPKLCQDPKARTGCAHGIGHALLRARVESGPTKGADASLTECDGLPKSVVSDCDNGVYMELAMQLKPAPVSVSDYTNICDKTSDIDRSLSCWAYLSTSFTSNEVKTADIPRWCGKAPLPAQYTCIEGYGRAIGVHAVAKCETSAPTAGLRERCVDGAVGLEVGSGHVSASAAQHACATLSAALGTYCTSAVRRYSTGRKLVESR